jgi:hypothetical protein
MLAVELPLSNQLHGFVGGLIFYELTWREHAQARTRVPVVIILEPGRQLLKDRDAVWPWVHTGIVALEGLDEGLANSVAFRTADRRGGLLPVCG